eukprot:GILK01000877.1.p1 GENE.GILK01000877.1~~GILK01000877.1.p1  ORF type:complete len:351 (+),score=38.98 GILK01000877.1:39-1055(+)
MKVDCHTHILPENFPDLAQRYGYPGFINLDHHRQGRARMMQDGKFFREVESNCWDCAVRLEECGRTDVDVQVLSTVPVMFSYWAKPEDTLDLSRMLNDHIAQCVSQNPDRFIGLGTLPMQAPDLAIQELHRCVNELGLAGVQIGTHINNWTLDAPELFPIFEAAEELGAAIFIHPWDMMGKELLNKYWLSWLVGMPAETTLAMCSLIFGGVLERLPKLRVCFAHGGGSFPGTLGRIEHGFNVRPDLCAINNNVPPSKYMGRFWVDSLVHEPEALKSIVRLFGEDKVCLGSDYPFPLGEEKPGALVEASEFDQEVKDKILSKNAFNWLGLSEEKYLHDN